MIKLFVKRACLLCIPVFLISWAFPGSASGTGDTVDSIDCSSPLGLLQLFFNTEPAEVKSLVLDSDAGQSNANNVYESLNPPWLISKDVDGNGLLNDDVDISELNGAAINPIDGKAYATASTKESNSGVYVVRFDRDGDLEFVMRFNNVTTINNGTFDSQGRFYSGARVGSDFLIQRWDNLADIVGQSTGSGMPLTAPSATGDIGVTNVPADISILEMNGVEYVVGRPNNISTLMLMDTRDMSALALDISSSVSRDGTTGAPPNGGGYGAAWTYEGLAYLSQNNGGGLWALNPDDVDTAGGSATLREVLSTTAITQANDGLGCPSESITEDQALPGSAGQATLVYHANGGDGDPDDLATSPDESVNLSELEPSRDGFSFTSWNSSEDGSGTSYGSGDAFVMPGDGETDHLHAQWTQNPVTTTTEVPVTTTTEVPVTTTTEVPGPQTLPATGSGSPSVPLIIMLIVAGVALVLVRRPSSDST